VHNIVTAPALKHKKHHITVKNGVLFLKRNLFDGAVLPANTELGHATSTDFPGVISSTEPAPPQFGYTNLEHILAFYNITPSSEHARQVASTLLFCDGITNVNQKEEEPQVCATTQRAAMDFATMVLGATAHATTTVVYGRTKPLKYVVAPKGITAIGSAVVPCHPLPYPTSVLYCHRPGGVQAIRVQLVGQEDPSLGATAIAVCHADTSDWDEEYFLMLNGTRGEAICHYMPEKYVLWLASKE
jgi:hypothetical protein